MEQKFRSRTLDRKKGRRILVLGTLGEKAFKSFDQCFGFGALGEKAFNSFGNYFGLGGIGRRRCSIVVAIMLILGD